MSCASCGHRLFDDRIEVKETFSVVDVETHKVLKSVKKFMAFCDDGCVEDYYWPEQKGG